MDIVTHGLASFAVARGFFPRAGKAAVAAAIVGGTIADVDWLSYYFGPSSYLTSHHTYAHSILGAILISAGVAAVIFRFLSQSKRNGAPISATVATNLPPILFAALCAALLHLAMDACQSSSVMLFWPFRSRRIAADWLPRIDPWILTILIACIAVPELLRLVSSEIGAKDKKPRGQTGAIIGLALVLTYIGTRATLHSNVVATMESRTFHGETPRRVSAFPETLSIFTWHGVVETESALDQIDVDATSANNFDPDTSMRLFKPEPSAALDAARKSAAAKKFLAAARIPKASVEKTESGYTVVLRDLRYAATGETQREVAAVIELDSNNKVTSEELVWAQELRR